MTHNPSIEIAWGGHWSRSQRQKCRPVAVGVVSFVADFAQQHAIEVRKPKRFTFCRGRPNTAARGLCSDAQSITLIVNKHHVARGSVDEDIFNIFEAGVHESVHAYRFERFPEHLIDDIDYAEHAVHEGLAYASGLVAFKPATSSESYVQLAKSVEALDPLVDSAQPREISILAQSVISQRGEDGRFGYYMGNRPARHNICESIGLVAVAALLDSGAPFAELLDTPADEVLRAAAAIMDSNE